MPTAGQKCVATVADADIAGPRLPACLPVRRMAAEAPLSSHGWTSFPDLPFSLRFFDQVFVPENENFLMGAVFIYLFFWRGGVYIIMQKKTHGLTGGATRKEIKLWVHFVKKEAVGEHSIWRLKSAK